RAALELRAQRELQVAFAAPNAAALSCYLPEIRTGWVEVDAPTAASTPVRVVEDVECFGTELECNPFGNRNGLEQSHVPVPEPGLINKVADALRGKSERCWLSKVRDTAEPLAGGSKCADHLR